MNKTLVILLLLMQGMTTESRSQQSKPPMPDNIKMLTPGHIYMNSINTRAIRDFISRHKEATDVIWYSLSNGFIVRFFDDSAMARSAYNCNGRWVYTIKQYLEKDMPRSVRHLVKSTYYDYEISLVEEVKQPGDLVKYVVHMQDNVSWKNVLVFDGQMELIEDRKKL